MTDGGDANTVRVSLGFLGIGTQAPVVAGNSGRPAEASAPPF